MSLFPIASFERLETADSDRALVAWGHYLGANERPFGRQEFGLFVNGELVSVAVSASTAGATCAGFSRYEVIELVRLASKPAYRMFTRVTLRLWRELAAAAWLADYPQKWQTVRALVSYSNETRHKGDVYRFDGWTKVAVVRGSTGGGTYSSKRPSEPKAVWTYEIRRAA